MCWVLTRYQHMICKYPLRPVGALLLRWWCSLMRRGFRLDGVRLPTVFLHCLCVWGQVQEIAARSSVARWVTLSLLSPSKVSFRHQDPKLLRISACVAQEEGTQMRTFARDPRPSSRFGKVSVTPQLHSVPNLHFDVLSCHRLAKTRGNVISLFGTRRYGRGPVRPLWPFPVSLAVYSAPGPEKRWRRPVWLGGRYRGCFSLLVTTQRLYLGSGPQVRQQPSRRKPRAACWVFAIMPTCSAHSSTKAETRMSRSPHALIGKAAIGKGSSVICLLSVRR